VDVTRGMRENTAETFGPVVGMKTGWGEEAIRLMNRCIRFPCG